MTIQVKYSPISCQGLAQDNSKRIKDVMGELYPYKRPWHK